MELNEWELRIWQPGHSEDPPVFLPAFLSLSCPFCLWSWTLITISLHSLYPVGLKNSLRPTVSWLISHTWNAGTSYCVPHPWSPYWLGKDIGTWVKKRTSHFKISSYSFFCDQYQALFCPLCFLMISIPHTIPSKLTKTLPVTGSPLAFKSFHLSLLILEWSCF